MLISDTSDPDISINFTCKDEGVTNIKSELQTCDIVQTTRFGESLFIDGSLQSTKSDEYIYHESLVHSLLSGLKSRNRILILGGAEGCTLREVLKWYDANHITQVDWDAELINYFKKNESWNDGAYNDKRVTVVCEDAVCWLENTTELFDAIIIDLCDPSDDKSAELLKRCCELAKSRLEPGGGIAMNCGDCGKSYVCEMADTVKEIFTDSRRMASRIFVPSFFAEWCLLFILPKLWSNTLTESAIPLGLKRFSLSELHRASQWPSDAPKSLSDFWKSNDKKLEAFTDLDDESVVSYYGY